MKGKVSAVICAAGKGERAGFGKNKLLAPLSGAPALFHTLKKFDIKEIDEVVVTSSKADFKEISALCKQFGYKVVQGGETRTESVKRALDAVTGDIVLIHDGARPYVDRRLILNCIDGVKRFGSAVCAVGLTDTAVSAELGLICDRLNRETTYRVQTPQGFLTEDIRRAYLLAGDKTYTDDSAVYCEFIAPARIIEDSEENVKLTFKSDYLRDMPQLTAFSGGARVGFGVDAHAFCKGDGITLGGVKIPFDKAFIAHSDGDVIIHAIMDALLSAAGLKDIGHYFPTDAAEFDGADSRLMLETVIKTLETAGYTPGNISVTVQAEKPRLAPYIDEMRKILAKICNLDEACVAVAAGTSEKLGFVGEGLGITAYAAVLLKGV